MASLNLLSKLVKFYRSGVNTQAAFFNKVVTTYFSNSKAVQSDKKSSGIPRNLLEEYITAHKQPTNGIIYDKKPFKILLKPNKTYSWCCCGWSKNQPFCDGSHKNPYIKIDLRPVRFMVEEEKEYFLCNCKQTTHRPFCDGTHKREDIQQAIRS